MNPPQRPAAALLAFPRIPLAEIEWHLARSDARRLLGDDLIADVAGRVGMTPEQALDQLATAPRWVLTDGGS